MWTSIIGTLCAGIFVVPAVFEYAEIKLRKREERAHQPEASETSPGDEGDELVPAAH